jgi:hypothetical protein
MSDIYNLAAHLDEFDGTLVRRGTPVEKHCSTPWANRINVNLLLQKLRINVGEIEPRSTLVKVEL